MWLYFLIFVGFGGCLNNLVVQGRPVDLSVYYLDLKNINFDGCPMSDPVQYSCNGYQLSTVYSGNQRDVFDYNLRPFTGNVFHTHKCLSSAVKLRRVKS